MQGSSEYRIKLFAACAFWEKNGETTMASVSSLTDALTELARAFTDDSKDGRTKFGGPGKFRNIPGRL